MVAPFIGWQGINPMRMDRFHSLWLNIGMRFSTSVWHIIWTHNPTDHADMFAAQLRDEFPHLDPKTVQYGGDDYDWNSRLEQERGRDRGVTDQQQYRRYRAMQRRRYGHRPYFNHNFFKD